MLRPNNFWRIEVWIFAFCIHIHLAIRTVRYDFRKIRLTPDLLKRKYCVS